MPPTMNGSNGDVRGAILTRFPDCVSHPTALVNRSRLPTNLIQVFCTNALLPKMTAEPLGPVDLAPPDGFGPPAGGAAAVAPPGGAPGGDGAPVPPGAGVTSTARFTGPLMSIPGSNPSVFDSRLTFT